MKNIIQRTTYFIYVDAQLVFRTFFIFKYVLKPITLMVVIPCKKKTVCLFKKIIKEAEEMAHLVRGPSCKQEYLDLDPRTQIKAAQDCVCTCTHWT